MATKLSPIKRFFINDHVVLAVILLNSIFIYLQETHGSHPLFSYVDMFCTLFFVTEMIIKHVSFGAKAYWQDGWNRFDGILVIISLPSLFTPFVDVSAFDFSVLLTLRLMRLLRLFRVLHFFPKISQIGAGLKRALRDSGVVLSAFALLLVVFGMINCGLYREVAPEYFGTPLDAIYSVFRVFTVEGWYEIPEAIMEATSPVIGKLSRLYFSLLLAAFGLLGMSFINSVFVDAMVEDNNDDLKLQLDRMEQKLNDLEKKLAEKK